MDTGWRAGGLGPPWAIASHGMPCHEASWISLVAHVVATEVDVIKLAYMPVFTTNRKP